MAMPGSLFSWRIGESDVGIVRDLARAFDLHEALARVVASRGYVDPQEVERFLKKSVNDLEDPFALEGMEAACKRLCQAVFAREKILVHGDFDADGITSAALLSLFFQELGLEVIPFVPDRLTEGHGISPRAIDLAIRSNVKLVVTCDCGVSSANEIARLREAGVETIVTDHHTIPEQLPLAIVVNPKMSHSDLDQAGLSGVGVAFMLTVGIRSKLREMGYFSNRAEPNLKQYLDIVALGTLADLAPLRGQNRILVAHGLEQLQRTLRPGILAMRESAGLANASSIHTDDVGFRLAPKINAAARLGHSFEALELLLTPERTRANSLAKKLEEWNQERRQLEAWMTRIASLEAEEQVAKERRAIVVSAAEFHPGVIGLVAQRLVRAYHLPSVVFSTQGEVAKGSGRSRGDIDLVAAFEQCSDLLFGFGGHKEAAGCTIETKRLLEFRQRFEAAIALQNSLDKGEILIDAELNLGHVDQRFLSDLDRLRPFGMGNREPVFLSKARVSGVPREVGKGHVRATLQGSSGPSYSAIGFGLWESVGRFIKGEVEVAFTPEENEWQGRREIQLRLHGVRGVRTV